MYRILFLSLTLVLLSCGNVKTIKVAQVERLYVEFNPDQSNNYGTPFPARVCAKMKNGEVKCLENSKNFVSSHNVHFQHRNQTVEVLAIPNAYDQNIVVVNLTMDDGNGNYISNNDTLVLNFKGRLTLGNNNANGLNGNSAADAGSALLFRYGKDGDNGTNGQHGSDGDNYDVFVIKKYGVYFIEVRNLAQGWIGKYQLHELNDFYLNASGGKGGNGGDGGDGGDGKDGEINGTKEKLPGDAGSAGNGGNGGDGGNGGKVNCYIHPSAREMADRIYIDVNPGSAGIGGEGGRAGKPGSAVSGQSQAKNGTGGMNGFNGRNGIPGEINIIEKVVEL